MAVAIGMAEILVVVIRGRLEPTRLDARPA
jgi:hypothetical protein